MELKLPLDIVSRVDINRVMRELDQLEPQFIGAKAATSQSAKPRVSVQLNNLAQENSIDLSDSNKRSQLREILKNIGQSAPSLHVSFASEAPLDVVQSILVWLRANIHPQVMLQIGLQPNLAAGCVLRTPNRLFDLSMRSYLKSQEGYLVQLIARKPNG